MARAVLGCCAASVLMLFAAGCTCEKFGVEQQRFACANDLECSSGFRCAVGACVACSGNACPHTANCGGRLVDLDLDPNNCGACGTVCPTPLHAAAGCRAQVCGHGPREPGFVDLDGATTPGCEARCEGKLLTDGKGATTQVTACPPPDAHWSAIVSSGAYGEAMQRSASNVHRATLGESTPPSLGPSPDPSGPGHRNLPGFRATETR